jgi:hypothetical protein
MTPMIRRRRRVVQPTPLPEGWQPDAALLAWAKIHAPGVDVAMQTEWLREWAGGEGAERTNWPLVWRNWMLRAQQVHETGRRWW